MAVIRTLDGSYYEIPDEILRTFRLPDDEVARHLGRVREGIRIDLAKEFKALEGGERQGGEAPRPSQE
jgi:hypothetical protein